MSLTSADLSAPALPSTTGTAPGLVTVDIKGGPPPAPPVAAQSRSSALGGSGSPYALAAGVHPEGDNEGERCWAAISIAT